MLSRCYMHRLSPVLYPLDVRHVETCREALVVSSDCEIGQTFIQSSDISLQVSTGPPDEQMHPREDYLHTITYPNTNPSKEPYNTQRMGREGETLNPSTMEAARR